MKLEHLEKASIALQRKEEAEKLHKELMKYPHRELDVRVDNCGRRAMFYTEHFREFVMGEIQALNLELHNLGVELPGVAQIEGQQAITKGMDQ